MFARLLLCSVAAAALVAQSPPVPAAPKPPAPPTLGDRVTRLAQPLAEKLPRGGFVVAVHHAGEEWVGGFAAPGESAPPGAATLYEIGSISKVYTGVLLAIAEQRGEVALGDPAQRHLPEGVVMPRFAGSDEPVQLLHLATHSSGLPRLPDMRGVDRADPYATFTRARLHELLPSTEVRWRPGSEYEYSNYAMGLLGDLLARRAGFASYDELLQQRLAAPLGLADTRVALDAARRARLAPPYDGNGREATNWDLAALAGAGGIRATAPDVLAFARAHFAADGPLAKALARAAENHWQGPVHDGKGRQQRMGLGWHFAPDGSRNHNGQTGGYHGYLAVDVPSRRAVVVLANLARGDFDRLGGALGKELAAR